MRISKTMRKTVLYLAVLTTILFFGGQANSVSAYAPSGAYLDIEPIGNEFFPGDMITVNVPVKQATDLYGLQVVCNVDPAVLRWESAQILDFFTEPLIGAKSLDADTGTWSTAISQKNPAPALSGDGDFATFTFEAIAPGTTAITCEPVASDRNGFTLPFSVENADITVVSLGDAGGVLSGSVTYQGRSEHVGIQLDLTGVADRSLTVDSSGQFTVSELRESAYEVKADGALHLPACASVDVARRQNVALASIVLAGGDTNDDDEIKINDATLIGSNFGLSSTSTPAMDPRADINTDGIVNVQDLSMLGGNFGKIGCQTWEIDDTSTSDPTPEPQPEPEPEPEPTPDPIPTSVAASCNPTNGSGGLKPGIHDVTVAGMKTTIVVGEDYDPSTPTYLTFHLHGDGGKIVDSFLSSSNAVTKYVDKQGWIFVAPQAPNSENIWWTKYNGDHVEKFADVLDHMFAKYNVCRDIVLGSSGSGGGVFWAGQFFVDKGDEYPAHVVMSCGASVANSSDRKKVEALGKDPEIVSRATFFQYYGAKDKIVPPSSIEGNISMYEKAGFNVDSLKLSNGGHCNEWKDQGYPGQSDRIVEKWSDWADEFGL